MKRKDLGVLSGGLMRCCMHCAFEWIDADPEAEVMDGTPIDCRFEGKATMIVAESCIRWDGGDAN